MAILHNNPGNIRLTSDNWLGQIRPGSSNTFVTFENQAYGYRALYKLLRNYIDQGTNTVNAIITRWAPPTENPTQSYINFVQAETQLGPFDWIKLTDHADIYRIGLAMTKFETGTIPDLIHASKGYEMAVNPQKYGSEQSDGSILAGFTLLGISLAALFGKK